MVSYSTYPNKKMFDIPNKERSEEEKSLIKEICKKQRKKNKEIVVIQGLGFVGAVMAAIISDCEINDRIPYFVLGIDLPSEQSYWKIPTINAGQSPFKVEDPEIELIFNRAVNVKKNLKATWVKESYAEADIIIVDINLDVIKLDLGDSRKFEIQMDSFKAAIKDIGKNMNPKSLVLIESTIPPGTIEKIVLPLINECFRERSIDLIQNPPLIAHSYERVMPGANYINSIKKIWRTFSAVNEIASRKTRMFLSNIIDTKEFPLMELQHTRASEFGKILENSYRAMNIAFIYEWTLFAEDIGINLFAVIDSIRVRKGTHDNMMYPGFGVGGYCLPKDTLLAEWASKELYHRDKELKFSLEAINVNDLMPHHTFELLQKGMGGDLKSKRVAILGASYRNDVGDTRNSPSIYLYDCIKYVGAYPIIHDPYSNFIEGRDDIRITKSINTTLKDAEGLVFTINHKQYVNISMNILVENLSKNSCIIDAFDVLDDKKILYLKQNGFKVLGVGKGHINNL